MIDGNFADRLIWLFGSPRTGSTWLMQLFSELPGVAVIDESYIPLHLVPIDHTVPDGEYFEQGQRANDPNYFFARRYMPELKPELRALLMQGLSRQLTELKQPADPSWIVIKEPNGSHAADSVMSMFPESRIVFLVRDGRDVIDSLIDAMLARDSWWQQSQASTSHGLSASGSHFHPTPRQPLAPRKMRCSAHTTPRPEAPTSAGGL